MSGSVPTARKQPGDASADARLDRLNQLLARQWAANAFLRARWERAGLASAPLTSLAELRRFPLVRREDVLHDQQAAPPLGTNRTVPPAAFSHLHRSSGTTRAPLHWADTAASWRRVVAASRKLFEISGITADDRLALALPDRASSGPAIMEAGVRALGCALLGLASVPDPDALRQLATFCPTALVGPPPQLLALGEALAHAGKSPARSGVSRLILTGQSTEPDFRRRLERLWSARCHDRYGCTEAGSLAAECGAHPGGLHLLDEWFFVETVEPGRDTPAGDDQPGELVVTSLLREEMPVIRYATGDVVRLRRNYRCVCGRQGSLLAGSVRRIG